MLTSVADAKLANISFADLIKYSSDIVVARVTRIDTIGGIRVATADVTQNIKGFHTRVRFVAGRTWACDTSTAVVGETALLCLAKPTLPATEKARTLIPTLLTLSYAGRGRIPLSAKGLHWVAKIRRAKPGWPWELNINLLAPKVKPLESTATEGLMKLTDLVRA